MTNDPQWAKRSIPTRSQQRAADIAAQIALAEIVRVLIREVLMHPSPAQFHARLGQLDALVTDGILARTIWDGADGYTETYIKEAATRWASSLISGIQHPNDPPSGDGAVEP